MRRQARQSARKCIHVCRRHRGLLTEDDFSRWSATIEDPVGHDYHGHTVLKCGPWSQGPVFLQQLALLQATDIGALDPVGVPFVHHVTLSSFFDSNWNQWREKILMTEGRGAIANERRKTQTHNMKQNNEK